MNIKKVHEAIAMLNMPFADGAFWTLSQINSKMIAFLEHEQNCSGR